METCSATPSQIDFVLSDNVPSTMPPTIAASASGIGLP
jgi:hypothetical protein